MRNSITSRVTDTLREKAILPAMLLVLLAAPVTAGEEWSEEHIMREISYLAKKLLDMSGKDAVTVESPAFVKPFIGICSEISPAGVKLTCVTPGTQAAKAGLQTGDLVVEMKGKSFVNEDEARTKKLYYGIVEEMKTGDEIGMSLIRNGVRKKLTVTVGSLSHPAYVLEVKR